VIGTASDKEAIMAKIRSPNYPALSLKESIERVSRVHDRERQHSANKEVVVKGMGYGAVHGASLGALSAALKYGLLEQDGRGQDYRVSDRALAILHPHSPEEKARALAEAARAPALFADLLDHFKGDLPSDDNLRAYLIRQGFTSSALPGVIQSFRDTMELVTPSGKEYKVSDGARDKGAPGDLQSMQQAARHSHGQNPPRVPLSERVEGQGQDQYKVTFTGNAIEIVGRIVSEADADALVRAVTALKLLLQSPTRVQYPEIPQAQDDPGAQLTERLAKGNDAVIAADHLRKRGT
jgi:hypothetical protein